VGVIPGIVVQKIFMGDVGLKEQKTDLAAKKHMN